MFLGKLIYEKTASVESNIEAVLILSYLELCCLGYCYSN
jgi:hypothetical protein